MFSLLAQATTEATVPVTGLLALLVFGIGFLLVLILKAKIQAFLSLLIVSVLVSVGATFVNPDAGSLISIGDTIVKSMGGALGFIATIIGIGAIFGAMLEHSGGTKALANTMVRKFGQERAPWAMLLTGFIISIPVFLDVALVILAPPAVRAGTRHQETTAHFRPAAGRRHGGHARICATDPGPGGSGLLP